jgi:hypothetical protein
LAAVHNAAGPGGSAEAGDSGGLMLMSAE